MATRMGCRTWRRFGRPARERIEHELVLFGSAHCPACGSALECRRSTRMAAVLPRGIDGVDLECRNCRLFHSRIRHSPHSLYMLRIHRLCAAVLRA